LLPLMMEKGLSASVYTELTDVEDEVNGLITYDRYQVKLPNTTEVVALHQSIINASIQLRSASAINGVAIVV
jgi:hypothetical protein